MTSRRSSLDDPHSGRAPRARPSGPEGRKNVNLRKRPGTTQGKGATEGGSIDAGRATNMERMTSSGQGARKTPGNLQGARGGSTAPTHQNGGCRGEAGKPGVGLDAGVGFGVV